MIALIQRVTRASVEVEGRIVGAIGPGLLAFVCAERGDADRVAQALAQRVLRYRVFPDGEGRMNRSLADVGGGLLVVSQFTLAADTRSGTRPSFTPAAAPDEGRRLVEVFAGTARAAHPGVAEGVFGASMQVSLVNDGPVTFWLRIAPAG